LKIISGGQTGVDRAALDAAIAVGLDYGGSIPLGRKAEDGFIDLRYTELIELSTAAYGARTGKNVMDGDATLIFTAGKPDGGTKLTIKLLRKHCKPSLLIYLANTGENEVVERVKNWLCKLGPRVLNVAGPRESKAPGIYAKVLEILTAVFRDIARGAYFS
jgi:hypothetical protein